MASALFSSSSINLLHELSADLTEELDARRARILADIDAHLGRLSVGSDDHDARSSSAASPTHTQQSQSESNTAAAATAAAADWAKHRALLELPQDVNSKAVISSLRTLQTKINQLELDKQAYENKISTLESELSHTQKLVTYYQNTDNKPVTLADMNNEKYAAARDKLYENEPNYNRLEDLLQASQREIDTLNRKIALLQRETAADAATSQLRADVEAQAALAAARNAEFRKESLARAAAIDKQAASAAAAEVPAPLSPRKSGENIGAFVGSKDLRHEASFLHEKEIDSIMHEIEQERSFLQTVDVRPDSADGKENAAMHKVLNNRIRSEYPTWREPPVTKIGKPKKSAPIPKKVVLLTGTTASRPASAKTRPARPVSAKIGPVRKQKPTSARSQSSLQSKKLPFINGTSTGKSYSVTANMQKVFAMIKSHTPKLCKLCHGQDRSVFCTHNSEDTKASEIATELRKLTQLMEVELDYFRMRKGDEKAAALKEEQLALLKSMIENTQAASATNDVRNAAASAATAAATALRHDVDIFPPHAQYAQEASVLDSLDVLRRAIKVQQALEDAQK